MNDIKLTKKPNNHFEHIWWWHVELWLRDFWWQQRQPCWGFYHTWGAARYYLSACVINLSHWICLDCFTICTWMESWSTLIF
jgi:hypothetical protein